MSDVQTHNENPGTVRLTIPGFSFFSRQSPRARVNANPEDRLPDRPVRPPVFPGCLSFPQKAGPLERNHGVKCAGCASNKAMPPAGGMRAETYFQEWLPRPAGRGVNTAEKANALAIAACMPASEWKVRRLGVKFRMTNATNAGRQRSGPPKGSHRK